MTVMGMVVVAKRRGVEARFFKMCLGSVDKKKVFFRFRAQSSHPIWRPVRSRHEVDCMTHVLARRSLTRSLCAILIMVKPFENASGGRARGAARRDMAGGEGAGERAP